MRLRSRKPRYIENHDVQRMLGLRPPAPPPKAGLAAAALVSFGLALALLAAWGLA